MKAALSSIKRRLDALPVWGVVLINLAVLGIWLADFDIPDSIPLDKILLTLMMGGSALYLWRRWFGPPSALAATTRRRLAEIETLYLETKKAAASLAGAEGVGAEILRLGALVERVRKVQLRLEQVELVLKSPQYSESDATGEVKRLESEAASADPKAKHDLEEALEEAKKHLANVGKIRGTRDQLGAAFERFFQIFRRIHSQVLGIGLAQGSRGELTGSVDELAKALDEYERESADQSKAEELLDRELAEDERKRQAGQTLRR